jgi:transposase
MAGTATGEAKSADGGGGVGARPARRPAIGDESKDPGSQPTARAALHRPPAVKGGPAGTRDRAARLEKASRFRCNARPGDPTVATKFAMRSVARRHCVLSEKIAELDARIERLIREAAPELVALDGVGPDTAAALLIAAGDNPERLKSEAAFAHLCGAAPVQASSGKLVRHRLNSGGKREALLRRCPWWRSTA